MKNRIILLLALTAFSCQPKVSNDIQTLEKVFDASTVDVIIVSNGSFHSFSHHLTLTKDGDDYILKSNETGRDKRISKDKAAALKAFIQKGFEDDGKLPCTTRQTVTVGTFLKSVSRTTADCEPLETEELNGILGYSSIVDNEN